MMLTMRFLLPLVLVLVACWASDPIFDDVSPQLIEIVESYRLSLENAVPIEYKIELEPIFESKNEKENFTFNGKSEITLSIKKKTDTVTFHAKELEFIDNDIKLTYNNKNNTKIENKLISSPLKDTTKDFVTLIFNETVPENTNAILFLKYTGKLNDQLRGFYRSSYQNKEGKKIWLATTQFEPVSARQAFPCWDEPQIKAKFSITITVPQIEDYKAISNMHEKKTTKDGKTIFETTPIMSTYLVAFVVSNFTALHNENKTFNVWAKPTVEESAKKFALDFGSKTLDELKDFTKIDYYGKDGQNMIKMDQIAIPDFSAGAMENWGLVTYRERRLLDIENKTTTEEKQAIATVIAHELSHQWFGNLVTCDWWDYIWLNEGFATFFQYYISDKVIPKLYDDKESWRLMEQFVIKNVQASSFVVDATSVTRPLNPKVSVQTPAQIRNLFDDIAYKKGASILYMMQGFLSEELFQEGLKIYLQDYKGKSVEPDKLFNSISSANITGKTVKNYLPDVDLNKVMDNWINEPGYPVITVTWSEIDSVNITQERFFLVKPIKEDNTQWYIPINYVTEESPEKVMPTDEKSRWMIPGTSTVLRELNNTKWILFNKDQTGYYRVNYDKSNWERLADYLKTPFYANISAINRAQLIDDALNLARAGYLAYETALKITLYLSKETDYIPWYAAVRAFDYLDDVLLGGKNYQTFRAYVVKKIEPFVSKVNYKDWQNGTHVDKLAKVLTLNTACKYGHMDCKDFVNKKLTEWLNKEEKDDEKNLPADMKNGILCAGLREANEETWKKILEKYIATKDEDEKADLLAGLGCASKEFAEKFLELIFVTKDPIVDVFAAINSICAGNPESFDILIKFIDNNIEKIQKADKEDNSLLTAFLNKLSNRVYTREQYVEFSLFINGKLQESQKYKALDIVINKLIWKETYQKKVEEWMVNNCEDCEGLQEGGSASSIILTSSLLIVSLLFTRFY